MLVNKIKMFAFFRSCNCSAWGSLKLAGNSRSTLRTYVLLTFQRLLYIVLISLDQFRFLMKFLQFCGITVLVEQIDHSLKGKFHNHSPLFVKTRFLSVMFWNTKWCPWRRACPLILVTLFRFSCAKKCSNEGRALMQLDFQQFLIKLEKLTSLRWLWKDVIWRKLYNYYLVVLCSQDELNVKDIIVVITDCPIMMAWSFWRKCNINSLWGITDS